MPQSDPRFFTSSSRKHDFRGSPGLTSQSDISQSSNYNKRSLSTSGKKFPSTKAFQNSVRGAARTFIMWLVPACGKSGEEAALHDLNIPENDVSSTSSMYTFQKAKKKKSMHLPVDINMREGQLFRHVLRNPILSTRFYLFLLDAN